jgi:sarcosine oxidase subunit alpha
MADAVTLRVNGKTVRVVPGTVVAAAVAQAGVTRFRADQHGAARGALCGMGVCFECRVAIDGVAQQRSCLTLCVEGMEVNTDA